MSRVLAFKMSKLYVFKKQIYLNFLQFNLLSIPLVIYKVIKVILKKSFPKMMIFSWIMARKTRNLFFSGEKCF